MKIGKILPQLVLQTRELKMDDKLWVPGDLMSMRFLEFARSRVERSSTWASKTHLREPGPKFGKPLFVLSTIVLFIVTMRIRTMIRKTDHGVQILRNRNRDLEVGQALMMKLPTMKAMLWSDADGWSWKILHLWTLTMRIL
jgi:hypothetical protein